MNEPTNGAATVAPAAAEVSPRPWRCNDAVTAQEFLSGGGVTATDPVTGAVTDVCYLPYDPAEITGDELRANARLMAAAPALLAACERIEAMMRRGAYTGHAGWDADYEAVRAALALATGEVDAR